MYRGLRLFSVFALVSIIFTERAGAFLFGHDRDSKRSVDQNSHSDHLPDPDQSVLSRLPNIYTVALSELQELESEPFCHRIAARLLVTNCQLLDGKDEATILTDSGRKIRDFVDSYAASLALCDLARGGFFIPQACSKFREDTLARLPVASQPTLHVTSAEIDSCLTSLARSDAAWSTWISYRHRSLRFCEAARADHEKTQNINLYQRITKILGNLANGIDLELEQRLAAADQKARDVADNIDQLTPKLDRLRDRVSTLDDILSGELLRVAQATAHHLTGGLAGVRDLEHALEMLLDRVSNLNTEVALSQEQAVQSASEQASNGLKTVVTAISAIGASLASFEDHFGTLHSQATGLAERQQALGASLESLGAMTTRFEAQHVTYLNQLEKSQQKAGVLLETLQSAQDSANGIQNSITARWRILDIWPYIICPVASLMMGSYNLSPSAPRNIGLIFIGEIAGFVISFANTYSFGDLSRQHSTIFHSSVLDHNATYSP